MKILTAINDEKTYKRLKKRINKETNNLVIKNIIYREGIIEFLEENTKDIDDEKINILVLDIDINGDISFKEIIRKVLEIDKAIEIIVLMELENRSNNNKINNKINSNNKVNVNNDDNKEIKSFLESYNINKIVIKESIEKDINKILNYITNDYKYIQNNLELEIEELRKIIFENKNKNMFKKIYNSLNKKRGNINNYIKKEKFKGKGKEKSKDRKKDRVIDKNEQKKNKQKNKNNEERSKNIKKTKEERSLKKNVKKNNFSNINNINKSNKIYIEVTEDMKEYKIEGIKITVKKKR